MRTRRIRKPKPRPKHPLRDGDREMPTVTSVRPVETSRAERRAELLNQLRTEHDAIERALAQWSGHPGD